MRFWQVCAALLALAWLAAAALPSSRAGGVVGSGTPASCTEAALTTALAGGGLVTFNCGSAPHTITVTAAKLITTATTIDGGGLVTLSGGGQTPILENTGPLLTLRHLTIADGYRTGDNGGGGVYSRWRSSLTVENCIFRNNVYHHTAGSNNDHGGGAIFLQSGLLTVSGSTFTGNRAENSSGGAVHLLYASAAISDTVFTGNHATGYAGALYSDGLNDTAAPFLRFTRVTFSENSGQGQGGAVFNWMYPYQRGSLVAYDSTLFRDNHVMPDSRGDALGGALRVGSGPLRITASAFVANTAAQQGGALWTGESASAALTNVTFSGNRADDGAGGGLGGAITIASSGEFTLTNVTLAYNQAAFMGGAVWGGSRVTARNTLFAHNTAGNPWGQNLQCEKTFAGSGNFQTPSGGNDRACAVGITLADPLLQPLADNGGRTPTHALPAASPAVDAGTRPCPPDDQRGRARDFDGDGDGLGQCDSGAYEYIGFDHLSHQQAAPVRRLYRTAAPALTWNPVTWAAAYAVEVDDSRDFASPLYAAEVSAGTLAAAPPPLSDGLYYWRVRAQRPDGSWGAWSAADAFAVMLP